MNQRDELASLTETLHAHRELWNIRGCFAGCSCGWDGFQKHHRRHQADAILAAGYSRPRVVETIEELAALPEGSVVMWDDYGNQAVAILGDEDYIEHTSNDYWNSRMDCIGLPATVIHQPEDKP
ncbi:hypothetical protein [Prescottella equi]|uniref:Uncharacterized protein n=1 Tax=Rhodococcus phage REQ3 TaxID=1109714 RepID=G9FH74_9CAUD|nr:hypothetical protein [Prescottella equi]YP_005087219.1 hypothetical protein RoPhREQ3_gp27 [Rhodococcus phage REQ3]AEV51963.1 hypothetical protein [Rhodococcus phage REQ3]ERN43262.1 hypothetical protein H849_24374 [Prescottella equi NBRC 101255 = C 7]ORL29055.1 hypothetical protein A6I89_01865 [Prescottella equi]QPQ77279.1 hypothetical protein I6H09_00095 [Prescottella equi]SUE04869.1 Uncharacterised protein [Prescottella equi]